jgi:hypothetical protein
VHATARATLAVPIGLGRRVKQNGYWPSRSGLCKKLKPLAIEFGCQDDHACYVPARAGETLGEALRNGIRPKRDNRHSAARGFHCSDRCGDCHDHIGLRRYQFVRHSGKLVGCAYAHVHHKISTLDEAKFGELTS